MSGAVAAMVAPAGLNAAAKKAELPERQPAAPPLPLLLIRKDGIWTGGGYYLNS